MLEGYPTKYLRCRTFGHAWEEFIPVGKEKGIGFRFSLLCTACGTERHDAIDTNGQLLNRQYEHPDEYYLGYVVPRSEARMVYNKRKRKRARRDNLIKTLEN